MDKLLAKQKIQQLVEKYQKLSEREIRSFTEEETKKDFILPLFEALGWGVYDRKEVSAEEAQSGGRVDYGFYLSSRLKFFLEAKSFKADLNSEDFAKQAIRYSWNRGADWAILTDFEGLKIFYAQAPSKYLQDKKYFELSYKSYFSDFEKLWELSKESFEKNIIEKNAIAAGKMPSKVSVSAMLYKDLNECRDILTDKLGKMNDKVPKNELDEGVQMILNRLIFIRVAEDRGIENKNLLISMIRQWESSPRKITLFQSMVNKFREMDKFYDSNLFDEHPFEKWDDYSEVTKQVVSILKGKAGYYEYDFRAMPADVLGGVYENYLNFKLSQSKKGLTLDKSAKKRKEQGIYYTPTFIVDYIVKNTLKPVLDKCKSIDALKKIKVLDPACGSGSFLIRAMDEISKKYEDFGARPDEYTKLTILLDNIFGVDLDDQAVEIARLNLLINALDCRMKLPDLSDNIKNGNSLILGSDEELKKFFGKNFRDKKSFNWQEEFPEVFKQGGFDVVIGNPPYVFSRGGNFDENEKKYYSENYQLQKYQLNTFSLFIERGINLLKDNGDFGFIIPNNWLTINSFAHLREYLLKNTGDLRIINAIDQVFSQAQVDTCLLIFKKSLPTNISLGELKENETPKLTSFKPKDFYKNEFVINITQNKKEHSNIKLTNFVELGKIAKISTGLKVYQIGKGKPKQTEKEKNIRKFHSREKLNDNYHKYLDGRDVKRYQQLWSGEFLYFGDWLAESRKSVPFSGKRILVRQIPSPFPHCINGVFLEEDYLNDINSMVIFNPEQNYDLKYILGIINSKLISYWFVNAFDKFQRKIFPQFKVNELARFPIFPATKVQQKIIVVLVDKMLSLQKQLQKSSENSNEWQRLKHEIELTDRKIDEEVYKLYGITEEERRVIEE